MKFLKFVLDYQGEGNAPLWQPRADQALADFLQTEFKLDQELRTYVVALTLSLDGRITVGSGLAAIHRHLTSMGVFGPGFSAVYPKWGGSSEIAQVACRAAAVGGAVYMLGTGIEEVLPPQGDDHHVQIALSSGVRVRANRLVSAPAAKLSGEGARVARLVAVIASQDAELFQVVVE